MSGVPSAAGAGFILQSYIPGVGHNLGSLGYKFIEYVCLRFIRALWISNLERNRFRFIVAFLTVTAGL